MTDYVVGKWISDGRSVFKLRETDRMKRVPGGVEPELEHEVYFQIQLTRNQNETPQATDYRGAFLASWIAQALNQQDR